MPAPYGSMLRMLWTNYHLLAAKQEPYQKVYPLTKEKEDFSAKKKEVRRMGQ